MSAGHEPFPLLADGSLSIEVCTAHHRDALHRWLPSLPRTGVEARGAIIRIVDADAEFPPPIDAPTLTLGSVSCVVRAHEALLRGSSGGYGTVDLDAMSATLRAPARADAAADVHSMLTIAAALLLNRGGRALLHAAAVNAPGGGVWLLAGDSHAGKSTTVANLMRSGLRWLSDDNVVLSGQGDVLCVEGWPRTFHLDRGWHTGAIAGERVNVDADSIAAASWLRTGRLAGVLLPRVRPDAPTAAGSAAAGESLAMLVRQSPWLMADAHAAADVLELLRRAALLPACHLHLGRDSYNDPARLRAALAALPGWQEVE